MALSCSDGITDGAKSSLIHVTLTATFGSPVTGMQASDFAVVGASIVDVSHAEHCPAVPPSSLMTLLSALTTTHRAPLLLSLELHTRWSLSWALLVM